MVLNLGDLDANEGEGQYEMPGDRYLTLTERNYNNLDIKLAREYQIDLSKVLWANNRYVCMRLLSLEVVVLTVAT